MPAVHCCKSPCTVCRVLQDLDGQVAFTQVYGLGSPYISPPHTYNLMPTTALLSFKSAVQASLQRRRLLVLVLLSAQPGFHLPAKILQHICRLAELTL